MGGSCVISATLGGGLVIDRRNVRWMAYDTGSGNVPAIGTSITQGGVSALPARRVGKPDRLRRQRSVQRCQRPASSSSARSQRPVYLGRIDRHRRECHGADVQGWIEVVADQLDNLNVPRLGKFKVRGGWFELGTTTGAAQQVVQTPTNGGGALTECSRPVDRGSESVDQRRIVERRRGHLHDHRRAPADYRHGRSGRRGDAIRLQHRGRRSRSSTRRSSRCR